MLPPWRSHPQACAPPGRASPACPPRGQRHSSCVRGAPRPLLSPPPCLAVPRCSRWPRARACCPAARRPRRRRRRPPRRTCCANRIGPRPGHTRMKTSHATTSRRTTAFTRRRAVVLVASRLLPLKLTLALDCWPRVYTPPAPVRDPHRRRRHCGTDGVLRARVPALWPLGRGATGRLLVLGAPPTLLSQRPG